MNLNRNGATFQALLAIVCSVALSCRRHPDLQSASDAGDRVLDTESGCQDSRPTSWIPWLRRLPFIRTRCWLRPSRHPHIRSKSSSSSNGWRKHEGLKDKALADAVAKQSWDPSVQALAALPDVVKRLADDIQWTTDLGNAFLAQQSDVMDAVQRMRKKAQDKGTLKSTEQQKVETRSSKARS